MQVVVAGTFYTDIGLEEDFFDWCLDRMGFEDVRSNGDGVTT